jgi:large subunit ribosomal protein L1
MEKEKVVKSLEELRKQEKKRNFDQSIDLIINLKRFDIKKDSVNLFVVFPNKVKEKNIAAFLSKKLGGVDCIIQPEFEKYKEKKKARSLAKSYDLFIASAKLMPQVAATFGKYLGPTGKMPSPQFGILTEETEAKVNDLVKKAQNLVRVKSKEPSLKFCVGKEKMKNEELAENIIVAYNTILNALPKKKESIHSVMIKLTMGKPIRIE